MCLKMFGLSAVLISLILMLMLVTSVQCTMKIETNDISFHENADDVVLQTILGDGLAKSSGVALETCQQQFQWDRWNCPRKDFINKRTTNKLDREAAFVQTLTFAASFYFVIIKCSKNVIEEPEFISNRQPRNAVKEMIKCTNSTQFNAKLINGFLQLHRQTRLDILTYAKKHNERAAWIAVRQVMRKNCHCNDLFNLCAGQTCRLTAANFSIIAREIRKMYDRSAMLSYDNNGQIDLKAPEDSLVFTYDSPNYCEVDAIPGWQGTLGRECSRNRNGDINAQERRSCRNLCRACGHRVRREVIRRSVRCNCSWNWCCNVTCDICHEHKEYYSCY